jgi:hypothetical protein
MLRGLGADHVVEGVVERAQVGVDLGHQVAGQEAQALARLDRRAGEDDALDLLGVQRLHRHGDREPALAGAGGADAERDDVLGDGVDVALLPGGLGPDPPPVGGAQHLVGEHLGRALVGLHHVDGARHQGAVERLAALQQRDQFAEHAAGPVGVGRRRCPPRCRARGWSARGNAASTMRSSSSRSPSRGPIRWLPGTWMVSWVLVNVCFQKTVFPDGTAEPVGVDERLGPALDPRRTRAVAERWPSRARRWWGYSRPP